MSTTDDLVNAAFERRQVPLLERLVDRPSCSREPADVEAAALVLDEEAEALGLLATRHPDPAGRFADHRVYETPAAREAGRCVALVGHVDTVFPRSLGFFGFRRDGDTAFGPGVLDMKSGLTSIFSALRALEDRDSLPVRVVVVSDEEVGSPSSAALYANLAASMSEALVFEAGREKDGIITSRKGTGGFTVSVEGRAAHSGLAHRDGINAIAALSHIVLRIEALTDYGRGVTWNVGLVEGGTSTNTVAAHASCRFDCRYVDPDDREGLEGLLRDAVNRPLPERLAGAHVTFEGRFHRPPMVARESDRDLCSRYGRHAARVGLGSGEAPLQGGGSDANLLSALGVPCIDGLGPAGAGIHDTSERCSLESLRRRTLALASFLADCGRAPIS